MRILMIMSLALGFLLISCEDKTNPDNNPYQLIVKFKMDDTAERQNNLGLPVGIPEGNAAQSPDFKKMGIHFLGIYQDKFTPYDDGESLLSTETTDQGGIKAIDFEKEFFFDEVDNVLKVDLADLKAGTYEYLRSSIAYQEYEIDFNIKGANLPDGIDDDIDAKGLLASFLGYNTYVSSYQLNESVIDINANKAQGYFGLESRVDIAGFMFSEVFQGDAPQTTVPNPISDSSPVPAGSCVVTGKFPEVLVIPEVATQDIEIEVVISTNKSFEWIDNNGNGKYEPILGEQVVDMGTRGFFPVVK